MGQVVTRLVQSLNAPGPSVLQAKLVCLFIYLTLYERGNNSSNECPVTFSSVTEGSQWL